MTYTNLEYLKDFTGDDEDLIKQSVQRYLAKSPSLLEDLNVSYAKKDWEKMSFTAHTLFGATQIVGMEAIKDDLREIEKKSKEVKSLDSIKDNIEKVNKAMKASFDELDHFK